MTGTRHRGLYSRFAAWACPVQCHSLCLTAVWSRLLLPTGSAVRLAAAAAVAAPGGDADGDGDGEGAD